jgi:hypothetical protein
MMERRGADAAVRSWPAARFRLTAIIVSAGQGLGLVMRPRRPLSCYLGLVIDHRFGDVPLEWVFKSLGYKPQDSVSVSEPRTFGMCTEGERQDQCGAASWPPLVLRWSA